MSSYRHAVYLKVAVKEIADVKALFHGFVVELVEVEIPVDPRSPCTLSIKVGDEVVLGDARGVFEVNLHGFGCENIFLNKSFQFYMG